MNYWDATTRIHLKRTVLYKQARLAGVGDSRGKGKDIHTHSLFLCCTAETNNIVKQLYLNLKKLKQALFIYEWQEGLLIVMKIYFNWVVVT